VGVKGVVAVVFSIELQSSLAVRGGTYSKDERPIQLGPELSILYFTILLPCFTDPTTWPDRPISGEFGQEI